MMYGIYVKKFLDRLQALQTQNARDFTMSMHDARNLHSDSTKLLIDVMNQSSADKPVSVEADGGTF